MKLIADRNLRGSWLTVNKGGEFEATAKQAAELIAAGAAHKAPNVVERAVAVEKVEKAVDEPLVLDEPESVTPIEPEPVADEPAEPAKRRGRKLASKKVAG